MSSREVKAGGAYIELTLKEKYRKDLSEAEKRLLHMQSVIENRASAAAAAAKQRLLQTVKGFRQIGLGLMVVGTATAAAGAGIFAMLASSVKTFLDVNAEAKKMGKTIAGLDPKNAERLSGAIKTLKAVWGAIQFRTGAAVAEPLTNLLMALSKIGASAATFISKNQGLVLTVVAIGAACLVAGAALLTLGTIFIFTASAISGAAAILTFILTPIGAIVALAAVLAAAVLLAAGAFLILTEASTGAVSGLLAAIATGDILGAWKIITEGMKSLWSIAISGMENMFFGMMQRVLKSWHEAFLSSGFVETIAGKKISAALSIASSAAQTGAGGQQAVASFDMARTLAELANISQESRNKFMQGFAGVSFKLPDLAQATGGGGQRFGVTGSTNATAAGMNRAMGDSLKEEKKQTEELKNIVKVLNEMGVSGSLEFAP